MLHLVDELMVEEGVGVERSVQLVTLWLEDETCVLLCPVTPPLHATFSVRLRFFTGYEYFAMSALALISF